MNGLYESTSFSQAYKQVIEPFLLQVLAEKSSASVLLPNLAYKYSIQEEWYQNPCTKGLSLDNITWLDPTLFTSYCRGHYLNNEKVATSKDIGVLVLALIRKLGISPRVIYDNPEIFEELSNFLEPGLTPKNQVFLLGLQKQLNSLLSNLGWVHPQNLIPTLLKKQKDSAPIWDNCLVYGFSALNWPTNSILELGFKCAKNVYFCFSSILGRGQELLLSSWEERSKKDIIILENNINTEIRTPKTPKVYLTSTHPEEAKFVFTAILEYLKDNPNNLPAQKLGIFFTNPKSLLAIELAYLLNKNHIPFWDTLGLASSQNYWQRTLESWINHQKNDNIEYLIDFLNHLHIALNDQNANSFDLYFLLKIIQKTNQSTFSNKASVITAYAKNDTLSHYATFLPATATFKDFHTLTTSLLYTFSPHLHEILLSILKEQLIFEFSEVIDKSEYLYYLEKSLQLQTPQNLSKNPHPFASIWLTTLESIPYRNWSHAVVCSLTEPDATFIHPLVNDSVRKKLNSQNILQGSQGLGQDIITPGAIYHLTRNEVQASYQYFLKTLLDKNIPLTFTACKVYTQDTFFDFIIQELHLTPEEILLDTQSYIHSLSQDNIHKPKIIEKLQKIYKKRQDPTISFDEHLFSFRKTDEFSFSLSCKAWEDCLERPALVWFKHILKTEPWPCNNPLNPSLLLGTWVHDWIMLESSSQAYIKPSIEEWQTLAKQKANAELTRLKNAHLEHSLPLPSLLLDYWKKALHTTLDLIQTCSACDFNFILSEWALPKGLEVTLPNGYILPLSGRIDAILAQSAIKLNVYNRDNQTHAIQVLDFKTGFKAPLSLKRLQSQGDGLQLALYALALETLGFKNTHLSIVLPKASISSQMHLNELSEASALWNTLQTIHQTGTFGMLGPIKNALGVSSYPIATIAIDESVLEAKQALLGNCL